MFGYVFWVPSLFHTNFKKVIFYPLSFFRVFCLSIVYNQLQRLFVWYKIFWDRQVQELLPPSGDLMIKRVDPRSCVNFDYVYADLQVIFSYSLLSCVRITYSSIFFFQIDYYFPVMVLPSSHVPHLAAILHCIRIENKHSFCPIYQHDRWGPSTR